MPQCGGLLCALWKNTKYTLKIFLPVITDFFVKIQATAVPLLGRLGTNNLNQNRTKHNKNRTRKFEPFTWSSTDSCVTLSYANDMHITRWAHCQRQVAFLR